MNVFRKSLLALLALVALVFPIAASTSPAFALNCQYCHAGLVYGGSGWAGSYKLPVGGQTRTVYCVEPHLWYAQGTYEWIGVDTSDAGQRMGWLMRYFDDTTNNEDAAVVSMLAAKHLAHSDEQWRSFPNLQDKANSYWDVEAWKNAGPYKIKDIRITQQPTYANGKAFKVEFWVSSAHGGMWWDFPREMVNTANFYNVENVNLYKIKDNATFEISGTVTNPLI